MTQSIPKGWREVRLGNVCDIQRGGSPRPINEYITDDVNGINWIKIGDVAEGEKYITKTKEKIKKSGIYKTRLVYKGDFILSNSMSFGRPYILKIDGAIHDGWLLIKIKDTTTIDKDYLYNVLSSPNLQSQYKSKATGSVVENLSSDIVRSVKIPLPPLDEQKRIADVLSAFDDKIENNRKINEILEKMAQTMFKAWFIDFTPTKELIKYEQGKSQYKTKSEIAKSLYMDEKTLNLFPNKFAKNGLPMGWEMKPLDSIADFLNGLALQKYPAESETEFLPVIKIAELRNGISEKTKKASVNIPEKYIVKNNDVIFSWSATLMQKIWAEGNGALNQHLFKVTSDTYEKWFYYMWIEYHLLEFREIATSKKTTMGHIQRKHLTNAQVIIPNNKILEYSNKFIGGLFKKIMINQQENKTLTEIRKTLLSKLISGKIRL